MLTFSIFRKPEVVMWPGAHLLFDGGSERMLAADENQSSAHVRALRFPERSHLSKVLMFSPDQTSRWEQNLHSSSWHWAFMLFSPPRLGPAAVRSVRLRATAFDGNGGDRNNHAVKSLTRVRPWQTTRDAVSSQHRGSLLYFLSSHALLTRLCCRQMWNNPLPSLKLTSFWQIPAFPTVIPSVPAEEVILKKKRKF